jgi:hypothetical protein
LAFNVVAGAILLLVALDTRWLRRTTPAEAA